MDPRVAAKLERHRRQGKTYPNAGAAVSINAGLTPEQVRFRNKLQIHNESGTVQGAEPASEVAQAEKRTGKARVDSSKDDAGKV
jgi:hypothetical protein